MKKKDCIKQKYFDNSKFLEIAKENIETVIPNYQNNLKELVLDDKKASYTNEDLFTIKSYLEKLIILKDDRMKTSSEYENIYNEEIKLLDNFNIEEILEKYIEKIATFASKIIENFKVILIDSKTELKSSFTNILETYSFVETVSIEDIESIIEKIDSTLLKIDNNNMTDDDIFDLTINCLKLINVRNKKLYLDNIHTINHEKELLIEEFNVIFKTIKKSETNLLTAIDEIAKINIKNASNISKIINKMIDDKMIKNENEMPEDYFSKFDFIFGLKDQEQKEVVKIDFPNFGQSEPIEISSREPFIIQFGTDKPSNVIIKTYKKIKDDIDFIKGLDTLFYRYLITFPNLAKQVSAIHKQIGSPLTVIGEICSTLPRCVLTLNGRTNLIDTDDAIRKALEEIGSIINSRKGELRNSAKIYKNIYEYNSENIDNAQNPIFLLIKDFPNGFDDPTTLENLTQIFSYSQEAGIFIVLIDSIDIVDKYKDVIESTRKELYSQAGYVFEHVSGSIVKNDTCLVDLKYISKDFNFRSFSESFNEIAKQVDRAIPLDKINDGWITKIKDKEDNSFSSSLDIPIGKEGANTKYINLTSKDTRVHVLVNGAPGSGKSEFLHTLILSSAMNYTPDELQIILIDFKEGVEFDIYRNAFPHIKFLALRGNSTDAVDILNYLVEIKENNNEKFKKLDNSKDIDEYNSKAITSGLPVIPRTLIIIDEYHKAIMNSNFLNKLETIAREGRSAGMSLVLVDQSVPSGGDFKIIKDQTGIMIAFPSNDIYSLIPECEKRKGELDVLKGLCFIKSSGTEISKVRIAYSGDNEKKHEIIEKIRNKFSEYPIKTKNVSNFQKLIISDNSAIEFSSSINKVNNELAICANMGLYRLTQKTLNYDINRTNKLLLVFGEYEYAINVFCSIMREYVHYNALTNFSRNKANIFVVDLNENIIMQRKTTLLKILRNSIGNNDSNFKFADGEIEFKEILEELNEEFDNRKNNKNAEIYPIQVFVANADKLSLDDKKLSNLLSKGEEVGIYFTFHFDDAQIFKTSRSDVMRQISNFKDSIIVPTSNAAMIDMYIKLYTNINSNELKELEKNIESQGLDDIFGLINDDGRISKFILNQYEENWIKTLLEEINYDNK